MKKYFLAPLPNAVAKPRMAAGSVRILPINPFDTPAHVRSQSVSELRCLLFPFPCFFFLG